MVVVVVVVVVVGGGGANGGGCPQASKGSSEVDTIEFTGQNNPCTFYDSEDELKRKSK